MYHKLLPIVGILFCAISIMITVGQTFTERSVAHFDRYLSRFRLHIETLTASLEPRLFGSIASVCTGAGTLTLLITQSPLIGLLVFVFALYFSLVAAEQHRLSKLELMTLHHWPDVLSELGLRIGAMGSPLPSAFFAAGSITPEELARAFRQAERSFGITGSFDSALITLKKLLSDPGTMIVTELLSVVQDAPGTDVTRLIEELRTDRLAEKDRHEEYNARLAGVRFARYFVIIVPAGMMLAGGTIAGLSPYQTTIGKYGIAFAVFVLVGCWIWAARLADPAKLYSERSSE